jgi:hypothetical protein
MSSGQLTRVCQAQPDGYFVIKSGSTSCQLIWLVVRQSRSPKELGSKLNVTLQQQSDLVALKNRYKLFARVYV